LISFAAMKSSRGNNGSKAKRNMHRNGPNGTPHNRTAVLVRCSADEAAAIRAAAIRERITVSGFILNAIANRVPPYQLPSQTPSRPKAKFHFAATGSGTSVWQQTDSNPSPAI
jgi:hypothetical protein